MGEELVMRLAASDRGVPTWLRASELPVFFPVFGDTTWRKFIRSGVLPSRKVGGARIVRVVDVERVLGGEEVSS